jgi:archaellum component FlaC
VCKTEFEQLNSDKNNLKKQLESKQKVLQSNNETKEQLETTIKGLRKLEDLLNQTVKDLCEHPKDVSTCEVAVPVRSLKYLTQSVSQT